MPGRPEWITWLRAEAAAWVNEGLIDESQRERIVARYPDTPPAPPRKEQHRSAKSLLPAVLVGLAVLLIGVGLILFYAANWKRMEPPVKLAQIFAVIIATYGGAFIFLFKRDAWTVAGRGLLMLGMLSFGAAIGLVAQTYHISAHPTNGILIWAIAVMAMSGLMRERWGLYLAFLLIFIWDVWERTVFHDVNYAMLPAVIVLYCLSDWIRSHIGRFVAVFLAILWFYEVNLHYLIRDEFEDAWLIFALMQIPFGCLLVAAGLALRERIGLALATTLRLIGWVAVYAPLIILSWPIEPEVAFLWELQGSTPFLIEFAVLTVIASALTFAVQQQGEGVWRFPAIGLAVGVTLIFMWLDAPGALMSVMVLALLSFHGATLLAGAKIGLPGASILAFLLACVSIVVRSIGHFVLAIDHEELLVAAGLSGFYFVAVVLLMNEAIRIRGSQGKPTSQLHVPLAAICLAFAYVVVYAVSFVSIDQAGLVAADADWFVAVVLIVALVVALWLYLWMARFSNVQFLVVSGITLLMALPILTFASDVVPSPLRQLLLNVMLFLMAGSLIAYAVRKNSTALLNVGVSVVVVHVMTRYFDVFWNMLHGSVFFIVTGVVLFAVAGIIMWQRNQLLKKMRRQSGEETRES